MSFKNKDFKKLFLVGIIILAVFLRLYKWDEKFSFNAEYNYKLWPMQKILVDKKLPLIGIEAVSYIHHLHYPPFFLYLFAPILYIGKFNPASIELFLIFFSGVTTFYFFLLGKEIKNETLGFMIAFMYAVSFLAQRSDRFIWVVGPVLFFTVVFLLMLLRSFKRKKFTLLQGLISGSIIGLGFNFHYQVGVLFGALIPFLFIREFRNRISLRSVLGFLTGIFFFISPLILFDLRHNFYNLYGVRLLFTYSSIGQPFIQRVISTFAVIANMMLSVFVSQYDPTRYAVSSMYITIPTVAFVFYAAFSLKQAAKKKHVQLLYSYIFFLLSTVTAALIFLKNNFSYYVFFLEPIFFLIITSFIINAFQRPRLRVIAVSLFIFFVFSNLYKTATFKIVSNWKQQQAAADFILSQSKQDKISIQFTSYSSEELAFLFYYEARKKNIDFESIEFYEPWQNGSNAEFAINSQFPYTDNVKSFGSLKVQLKKETLK